MTIEVLGLGPSLKNYTDVGNITIGVNDIWRYHPVHFLVTADPPSRFTTERKNVILNSKPEMFLSAFTDWRGLVDKYYYMKLESGSGRLTKLDTRAVYSFSNNSTFIACVLAYKLRAKNILLHGVDFTDHHSLSKPQILDKVIRDFKGLAVAVKNRGVEIAVSSAQSALAQVLPIKSVASLARGE